jgi:hypothetical protein
MSMRSRGRQVCAVVRVGGWADVAGTSMRRRRGRRERALAIPFVKCGSVCGRMEVGLMFSGKNWAKITQERVLGVRQWLGFLY